jgi:hypothetical protein
LGLDDGTLIMLELKLLGNLELSGPTGRIDLSSAKLGALLAYLAYMPRAAAA